MNFKLKKESFISFLKGISLGGIIKDTVFNVDNQILSSKNIDTLSVLFVLAKIKVNTDEKIKFGVRDLPLFQKAITDLTKGEEVHIVIKEDSIYLDNRKMTFNVAVPEEIETYFSNDEKLSSLLKNYKDIFELQFKQLEELKQYLSVFM